MVLSSAVSWLPRAPHVLEGPHDLPARRFSSVDQHRQRTLRPDESRPNARLTPADRRDSSCGRPVASVRALRAPPSPPGRVPHAARPHALPATGRVLLRPFDAPRPLAQRSAGLPLPRRARCWRSGPRDRLVLFRTSAVASSSPGTANTHGVPVAPLTRAITIPAEKRDVSEDRGCASGGRVGVDRQVEAPDRNIRSAGDVQEVSPAAVDLGRHC